ncbi:MAG: FlgD immunoglobulin-like domain containing protein [bacterium]
MNHESPATKIFVDRVNAFWLQEYKFDGFRFDFTKGMTNTPGDGSAYDPARIAILKRMADQIWAVDPGAYVILEHFAENREEIELSDYGMLLWGNTNFNYNEATMGYHSNGKSDFSWGYYGTRGWNQPNLVTYMESHDEERLMVKNLSFGNSNSDYSVKDLATALDRIKLAATFFLTLPGPKMIWQFGELGYDVSIDNPCRVCEKPIRWQYFADATRNKLYRTYQALLKLRRENEVFRSRDTQVDLLLNRGDGGKRIRLSHKSMNASIIGNFGVTVLSVSPNFIHRGLWFEYFSGDTLDVLDPAATIALAPGEFRIYTDKKLERPDPDIITAIDDFNASVPISYTLQQNYPNPFNPETAIRFQLPENSIVELKIFNSIGQMVQTLIKKAPKPAGSYTANWDGRNDTGQPAPSGLYFYRLTAHSGSRTFTRTKKMLLLR